MSAVTYLHDLKVVHGDLKAVRPIPFTAGSPSLTGEAGKHPRRQDGRCSCHRFRSYDYD